MIRSGLIFRSDSESMPHARIAFGETFSITTSAHATRRKAISRASEADILSERPYLPTFALLKPPERSTPAWPSLKGPTVRSASSFLALSTRMTVAP